MNAVAFYLLKGRLLVAFCEIEGGGTICLTFKNVEPSQIAAKLDESLGFQFRAMCLVMSSREQFSSPMTRQKPGDGLSASFYCEANTMPRSELR